MKKRDFLHAATQACALIAAAPGAAGQSSAKPEPPAARDGALADFLRDTETIRRRLFTGGGSPDPEIRALAAKEIEPAALKHFGAKAAAGSRRHQFYLGRVYYDLHWMTKEDGHRDTFRKFFAAAAAQGHPNAVYRPIERYPERNNFEEYDKAIRLGSVDALGMCSGPYTHTMGPDEWMKTGPILYSPGDGGVEKWSGIFRNWMIIYHFLPEWDRSGGTLRLNFPSDKVVGIVSGVDPPGEGYEEEFSVTFMRDIINEAAEHARKMDKDFYPEEIHDWTWERLFRPRDP